MNVNLQAIAAMRATTISREYGSGVLPQTGLASWASRQAAESPSVWHLSTTRIVVQISRLRSMVLFGRISLFQTMRLRCLSLLLVMMIWRSLMSAFLHLLVGPAVGEVFFFLLGTLTQISVFFLMSKFFVPSEAAATAFHLMLDLGFPVGFS